MQQRTKGQIESQISEAIIKFEKEYMGRGPTETKTGERIIIFTLNQDLEDRFPNRRSS